MTSGDSPGGTAALAVWRHGLAPAAMIEMSPAGRAWLAESARIRAAYDRLRTDPRSPLGDRVGAIDRLQTLAADSDRLTAELERLRAELVARLHAGALFAVGFHVLAEGRATERLAAIPPAAWAPIAAVEWPSSILTTVAGDVWRDVRVLPPPALPHGRRPVAVAPPDRGQLNAPSSRRPPLPRLR